MTDENQKKADAEDAGLQKLIRSIDRRERFKRRLGAGALAGTAVVSPFADIATESYELPPLPDCTSFTTNVIQDISVDEPGRRVVTDLVDAPASNSSMVIQAILISAGDEHKMRLMDKALQIAIKTEQDAESDAYRQSCPIHDELRDITLFNPALYDKATYAEMKDDPANYVTFQALAAFKDPASDNILRAYFEPVTGTLSIETVGMTPDEDYERALAVLSGNTDRVIPYDLAGQFVNELRSTILENKLTVNRTAIASHSMGASGGILIKGLLESSRVNALVFGKNPSLTIIEGFGESLAAETVSKELDIPMDRLTRNSNTLRSIKDGAANIVAHEWDTNRPIGGNVYAVNTTAVDTHALPDMAIGLLNGKRTIEPYDGEFRTAGGEAVLTEVGQFAGKLAKAGREIREGLGLGG